MGQSAGSKPRLGSSFSSAGTVARINGRVPELLVIQFFEARHRYGPGRLRKKFPGGDGEIGETPEQALERELQEEIAGENFALVESQKFFEIPVSYEHTKNFFLFRYKGLLREKKKEEDDGDTIYPPHFVSVVDLHKDFEFVADHRIALEEAVLYLAKEYVEFAWAAKEMGLLDEKLKLV